jgi:leucyl aminopeptidase (aminopeptidase T)
VPLWQENNSENMTKIEKAALTVIRRCLNVQKNESVLVLATAAHMEIADLLIRAAQKVTKEVYLLQVTNQIILNGLNKIIATCMQNMNVVLAVTSPSISHTEARRNACRKGARIASLPGITPATFTRLADTDFVKVARLSKKLRDILTIGKEIKVTAPNGTNLFIPVSDHSGYADLGLLHNPGTFSNLPAGEACLAPDDGKTQGELVVDCGMGIYNEDKQRLVITIKDGRAARIFGGEAAQKLRQRLAKYGTKSRLIAEFGIGTNASAKICGSPLEDEKVSGTIHLALGNNVSFGGKNDVPVHMDGVVYQATVEIDGRKILDNGKLLLT